MGAFSPSDSHHMVYFIVLEIGYGFPHQFLMVRGNVTKPIVLGEPGKLYSYFSHSMGDFFIIYPPCGMLHHMGHARVFLSISHSMEKDNQIHRMRKARQICSHTFFIVWVLFSIRFPPSGILYHMGNALIFSSISSKNPWNGKSLGIGSRGNPTKFIVCGEPGKSPLFPHGKEKGHWEEVSVQVRCSANIWKFCRERE